MLQGFHWQAQSVGEQIGRPWYAIIKENAQRIKDSGFTLVWFPPPSDSLAYEGYLPRKLDVLDSRYGSKSELKEAIAALDSVKAIADIVVNHRVGTTGPADFTEPKWSRFTITKDDEYTGRTSFNLDSGEGYGPARDLDHLNPETQKGIITWMNSLKDLDDTDGTDVTGFKGWRYDLVKGFAGWAVELYNKQTETEFSVGEYFDYDPQKVVGWIDSTHPNPAFRSAAFDFPLRNVLYEAITKRKFHYLKYGDRAPGVIGLWSDKAVTFIENHDTEDVRDSEYAPYFPGRSQMVQGYAYILTHPGIPCVFWGDIYDSGMLHENEIRRLIEIRTRYRIHSESKLYIAAAQEGLMYAAYIQGDEGEIAMKIGPGSWQPSGSKWQIEPGKDLLISGPDYAVWGDRGRFWT